MWGKMAKKTGKGKTKFNTYEVFDGLKAIRILYGRRVRLFFFP